MYQINTTKIIMYICKFIILPTPIGFALYYDLFDFDLFGTKRIEILKKEVVELEIMNENKQKKINLMENQISNTYDMQNILLYTIGAITTIAITYYIYMYFNGDTDSCGVIIDQATQNSKTIIDSAESLAKNTNNLLKDSSNTIMTHNSKNTHSTIKTITEVIANNTADIKNTSEILNKNNIEGISKALESNNNNTTKLVNSVIDYIYNNVTNKLNNISNKIEKCSDILENVLEEIDNKSNVSWGPGRTLNTGEFITENLTPTKDIYLLGDNNIEFD